MEIRKIVITEDQRRVVSDFMGEEYPLEIDFNWLMPVVEKIEKLGYAVYISRSGIQIWKYEIGRTGKATDLIIDEDFKRDYPLPERLTDAFYSIVSFIEWYNNQLKG